MYYELWKSKLKLIKGVLNVVDISNGIAKKEMKSKMDQLFEDQKNVHVLYSYNDMENYLKQVLSYIENGIAAGDYVILIENDRIYPIINKELSIV